MSSSTAENIAIAEASREIIQRYGNAGLEFIKAYQGLNNETGQVLRRSLKSVSQSSVNTDYINQNLRQQSGFSAEILDTAQTNAENIINNNPTRAIRTDDLTARNDSRFGQIGGTNDQLYDQALIRDGRIVDASQFKFVGSSPEQALEKIAGKKFDKYINNGVKISVPSDYYDGIKSEIPRKIESLQAQHSKALQSGNQALADQTAQKIEKYRKIDSCLSKSKISNSEAMQARLNPTFTTAKNIANISHSAGIQGAKFGGMISGGVSLVKNISDYISGDKDFSEAAIDVVIDTGKGAVYAYTSTFGITALTSVMKNSGSSLMRSIAKTNFPVQIATAILEAGKTLLKFSSGEIDGLECLEELGQKGTNIASSAVFASVGQAIIPIPVVGAVAGSMIGYAISGSLYGAFVDTLKAEKFSREERIRIERECNEAINALKEYHEKINSLISQYLTDYIMTFNTAFDIMKESLNIGDIDGFISGANAITQKLGGTVQFSNMNEFNNFMDSDEAFIL